jgi:hypothetical protein
MHAPPAEAREIQRISIEVPFVEALLVGSVAVRDSKFSGGAEVIDCSGTKPSRSTE